MALAADMDLDRIKVAVACLDMNFAHRSKVYDSVFEVELDIDYGLPLVNEFGKQMDNEDIAGQKNDKEHSHKAVPDIIGFVSYCSILNSLLPLIMIY